MKLNAADQRLEGKLKELYKTHMERTAKIDWSYHRLVPWERGRNFESDPWHPSQAKISPELTIAVETALLTEINLPWFTAGLTNIFAGSLEVLQDFVRTWTSEEDQHSNLLEVYLLVTRSGNPDRLHQLRKTVLRNAWTPGEATALEGMIYTMVQELSTQAFYVNVAKRADSEDPVLANILRTIAKDETLHFTFYREAVKAHLEIMPNRIEIVCQIFRHFAMPGYLMPNFAERQRVLAHGANYGIAEYFQSVVEILVKQLGINDLMPKGKKAQAALKDFNRYLDGLARLAARPRKSSDKEIRALANRLLGYEEDGITELEKPFEISTYVPPQLVGQISVRSEITQTSKTQK